MATLDEESLAILNRIRAIDVVLASDDLSHLYQAVCHRVSVQGASLIDLKEVVVYLLVFGFKGYHDLVFASEMNMAVLICRLLVLAVIK